MKLAILIALVFTVTSYPASGYLFHGDARDSWPQTDHSKVKNDFGGYLVVTSNMNWRQKWETDPETVPIFDEAKKIKRGEKLVVLTFFVNPKTDAKNNTNVLCSVEVIRPDKTISVNLKDISCLKGPLKGSPDYIRLAPPIINFVGEKSDPTGTWVVNVSLKDVNRDTELKLKTNFVLTE